MEKIINKMIGSGIFKDAIITGNVRFQTIAYMVYWYHRLKNNVEEQHRIKENLTEYIGMSAVDNKLSSQSLLLDDELLFTSKSFVETQLMPIKTVDLVITKGAPCDSSDNAVLCMERTYYPFGVALPGGIIREDDEDNNLHLSAEAFAALRIAGEKVLGLKGDAHYSNHTNLNGGVSFVVHGNAQKPSITLHLEDEGGYRYRENIKSVLRPSDPRHIVDTIAFKCEITGEPSVNTVWKSKAAIMLPEVPAGGFAFGHHREIVAHILARTSVEKERRMQEREFIRSIIKNPLETYYSLKLRFGLNNNSPETSFKELFPVVDKIISEMFADEINALCSESPILAGIRDKAIISLRHVCLKNRVFCPYLPTLRAIAEGIAFFDYVARHKRKFYEVMPKGSICEHNPQTTPNASYHMYRYKYRLDQLMNMVPGEILIPTFESLSATDIMKVRGVPIRFLGLSLDFLYVDEFEQSPEEFFMHDCNHSWRMIMEDRKAETAYFKSKEKLIEESNSFIDEYLELIKIRKTDTEE